MIIDTCSGNGPSTEIIDNWAIEIMCSCNMKNCANVIEKRIVLL